MIFRHDVERALGTVVELVNTLPDCAGTELLPDAAAMRAFVERRVPGPVADVEAVALLRMRATLLEIVVAATEGQAAELLNGLLAQLPVRTRLATRDGSPWHLQYRAKGPSAGEQLAVDCALALAQVLTDGGRERLARCAAPDCARMLVDLSRNHSKRYCDARTCGNRLHVAAYRERQRGIVHP